MTANNSRPAQAMVLSAARWAFGKRKHGGGGAGPLASDQPFRKNGAEPRSLKRTPCFEVITLTRHRQI